MSEDPRKREMRRIRRLLRETADMAKHASITGDLETGARSSVRQYNKVLQYLGHQGEIPHNFFEPLDDDAGFGEVGVAAAQLAGYVEDDEPGEIEEDEVFHRETGPGRRHRIRMRRGGPVINLGFGGLRELKELKDLKELEELKDIGRIIRENLPDWILEVKGERRSEGHHIPPDHNPHAPHDPGSPSEGEFGADPGGNSANLNQVELEMANAAARLQAVAGELGRADLPVDQRTALAEELAQLGQEQARLAREHARLRDR